MRVGILGFAILFALVLTAGGLLRLSDVRTETRVWEFLSQSPEEVPPVFDLSMIEDLPPIAQRYFLHAIALGTPLVRRVELESSGEFILNGHSLPLQARQILVAPDIGFVWRAWIGTGPLRIIGSDGLLRRTPDDIESWTRFGIQNAVPVERSGGTTDHALSASTRVMMEALWAPASLLPLYGARWTQTGPNTADITFTGLQALQTMHLRLDEDGAPVEVWATRWSNANPDGVYRRQPFGGRIYETRAFEGFTIPSRLEMGNNWGTPDYAPFYIVEIDHAAF